MQKRLFAGIAIFLVAIGTIVLTYFVSKLLDFSINFQILVTGTVGIVAFLGALAEVSGYNLRTLYEMFVAQKMYKAMSPPAKDRNSAKSNLISEFSTGLPSKPYVRLVGREQQISEIIRVLQDPSGAPIISLTGIGGIGKTAIAYEVSERLLKQQLFKDIIWLSAKQEIFIGDHIESNKGGIPAYDDVMNHVFERLVGTSPLSKQNRDSELHRLLKTSSYLLVLDNLETLYDEISLLRSLPAFLYPSRALCTSRTSLGQINGIYTSTISGLSETHSLEFIRYEASIRGVKSLEKASEKILFRIHHETGGMPLAIRLVVGEVLAGLSIDAVLDRLRHAGGEEELYRFIYFDLWNTLTDPARIILVSMPAFALSANSKMIAEVSRLSSADFDEGVVELVHKSLLEVNNGVTSSQRRYSIHALTRNFLLSDLPTIFDMR